MFYIEQDDKIVLFDENLQTLQNTILFMPQYAGLEIKEVQEGYVISDFELMTVEEKEKKEAQKERERIAMLNLTGADVERGIYKAKGMDFDDIIAYLEAQPLTEDGTPQVDIKALKIELKANNFYRGNPYVETIGKLLGFTDTQLNNFFETGDYRELLPIEDEAIDDSTTDTTVTLTINPTPSDATVTINSEAKNTVTVPYGDTVEYSVAAEGYLTQSGTVELTEDTTLDIELVKEGVNEGGIEEPPIEEETAEEENVNNEVEDENTTV